MRGLLPLILAGLLAAGQAPMVLAGEGCKCRGADGKSYDQGELLCIRGKLARCLMSQNVPAWSVVAPDCPEAAIQPKPAPKPARSAALSR